MDSRIHILLLLDYKQVFGEDKKLQDAAELIQDIPSVTMLRCIALISMNHYLRETEPEGGKWQGWFIETILSKGTSGTRDLILDKIRTCGHNPVIFWNYSNLLFYGLILMNFNDQENSDLSQEQADKFIRAYLIVNSIANSKIKLNELTMKEADIKNELEIALSPAFIYQRDYKSTLDYMNQVIRGVGMFKYLEANQRYGGLMDDYYKHLHVTGWKELFRNLLGINAELDFVNEDVRNPLVDLSEHFQYGTVNITFVQSLCVNSYRNNYQQDESFGQLRTKMLYQLDADRYLILDINFLIDQFYKAQVFALNNFFKSRGLKNFLSDKAKDYMETLHLKEVVKRCFPKNVHYLGDVARNSKGDELCDVYIRHGNRIALFEFKDVLLNAAAKNQGDSAKLFLEFDKKFLANQFGKPKGVTQLIQAFKDIDQAGLGFDQVSITEDVEIFPIILYSDNAFGVEGLNKQYKAKFATHIEDEHITKFTVKPLTFVSLSFLELQEQFLADGRLDIFSMMDQYHEHTSQKDYDLTSFEVFAGLYMDSHLPVKGDLPNYYKELIQSIVISGAA